MQRSWQHCKIPPQNCQVSGLYILPSSSLVSVNSAHTTRIEGSPNKLRGSESNLKLSHLINKHKIWFLMISSIFAYLNNIKLFPSFFGAIKMNNKTSPIFLIKEKSTKNIWSNYGYRFETNIHLNDPPKFSYIPPPPWSPPQVIPARGRILLCFPMNTVFNHLYLKRIALCCSYSIPILSPLLNNDYIDFTNIY